MKMFLIEIDMPYRYSQVDAEQLKASDATLVSSLLFDAGVSDAQISKLTYVSDQVVVTAEQLAVLMINLSHEYNKPYIKKVDMIGDFGGNGHDQILGMLARIEAAATVLEHRADLSTEFMGDHYNPHANSPVPGPILAEFNDLMLCENSCTDAVQGYLDEGWRIVAVCPQAARRPDYILGKYTPGLTQASARRG